MSYRSSPSFARRPAPISAGMPVGGRPSHRNERFPFELFKPHERQALHNHGQTLERLAELGGLSWAEALAIIEDRTVFDGPRAGQESRFRDAFAAWQQEAAA